MTQENMNTQAIISINQTGPYSSVAYHKALGAKEISVVDKVAGPETLFINMKIKKGDCILVKKAEEMQLTVNQASKSLLPIVLFSKDEGKRFGLLVKESLTTFTKTETKKPTPIFEILEYKPEGDQDLTLIYVACPKSRNDICKLFVKHKGEWVMNGDKIFYIDSLARSKRIDGPHKDTYRITKGGDSPQGIYTVWASMKSDALGFGKMPRIDLEGAEPALNSSPYPMRSYLLEKIVPKKTLTEYWTNELPLAMKLGRLFLRVHDNSLKPDAPIFTTDSGMKFTPTSGCVNTGRSIGKLFKRLIDLGVFAKEDVFGTNSNDLNWKTPKKLGKTFLILKDY